MENHRKSRYVNIELDENYKALNITFSDKRTTKRNFNHTIEKIIRLGVQQCNDPRFQTIYLKSYSPKTFKYMGDYLAGKFQEFRKKVGETREARIGYETVEVKCLYNEMEVMKFHFDLQSASFLW
jgi:hypothetical protein